MVFVTFQYVSFALVNPEYPYTQVKIDTSCLHPWGNWQLSNSQTDFHSSCISKQ